MIIILIIIIDNKIFFLLLFLLFYQTIPIIIAVIVWMGAWNIIFILSYVFLHALGLLSAVFLCGLWRHCS